MYKLESNYMYFACDNYFSTDLLLLRMEEEHIHVYFFFLEFKYMY